MNIDLRGKVAVVTGAGRGIGRVIATTLASEGVKTVVTDIDQGRLNEVAEEFKTNSWEGRQFVCDVRNLERIQEVVGQIAQEYGRIDILVNNAGVLATGPIETLPEEAWERNLDVNLTGIFLMCKAVIPIMKKQKAGRIINAASFAAIVPSIGSAAYAASKAGVVSLTRVLAGELGPWNITANCYAPGMIPSEMNHFADAAPQQQQRLLDTLSLRRWGQEKDIAQLICFLASDLAGYITGSLIDISGGKLATQIPRVAYESAAEQGEYRFE